MKLRAGANANNSVRYVRVSSAMTRSRPWSVKIFAAQEPSETPGMKWSGTDERWCPE